MTEEKKHSEVTPLTVYSLIGLIIGILMWTGGLMVLVTQIFIWWIKISLQSIRILMEFGYILMGASYILIGIIAILWIPQTLVGIVTSIVLGLIGIVTISIGIDGSFSVVTNVLMGLSMMLLAKQIFSSLSSKKD